MRSRGKEEAYVPPDLLVSCKTAAGVVRWIGYRRSRGHEEAYVPPDLLVSCKTAAGVIREIGT